MARPMFSFVLHAVSSRLMLLKVSHVSVKLRSLMHEKCTDNAEYEEDDRCNCHLVKRFITLISVFTLIEITRL